MNILSKSFLISIIVFIYVILISLILFSAENFINQITTIFGFTAFLLVLIISVSVCGGLIFGIPAMKITKGDQKAGIKLFLADLMWLVIFTLISFVILSIIEN